MSSVHVPLVFVLAVLSAQKSLSPYKHMNVRNVTDSVLSTQDVIQLFIDSFTHQTKIIYYTYK